MEMHKISKIIARVIKENRQPLDEVRTALKPKYREKSLRSGNERRNRVGDEFAAFDPPVEKSPGRKPRNIKPDEARKTNKKIIFDPKKDKKNINESYDFMIEKPTGYGTFMTAKDLGIKFESAFEHHPSVVKELYRRKTRRKRKYNSGE